MAQILEILDIRAGSFPIGCLDAIQMIVLRVIFVLDPFQRVRVIGLR